MPQFNNMLDGFQYLLMVFVLFAPAILPFFYLALKWLQPRERRRLLQGLSLAPGSGPPQPLPPARPPGEPPVVVVPSKERPAA